MAEPFLGELRLVAFGWVPRYWAACDGQLLTISQNTALFSLLGTMYGGDGRTTFALPDLRGRHAMHVGLANVAGQRLGTETVTLERRHVPQEVLAADVPQATNRAGSGAALARGGRYTTQGGALLASVGAGQPHENRSPYLVMNWIIATQGIFPSRG